MTEAALQEKVEPGLREIISAHSDPETPLPVRVYLRGKWTPARHLQMEAAGFVFRSIADDTMFGKVAPRDMDGLVSLDYVVRVEFDNYNYTPQNRD